MRIDLDGRGRYQLIAQLVALQASAASRGAALPPGGDRFPVDSLFLRWGKMWGTWHELPNTCGDLCTPPLFLSALIMNTLVHLAGQLGRFESSRPDHIHPAC